MAPPAIRDCHMLQLPKNPLAPQCQGGTILSMKKKPLTEIEGIHYTELLCYNCGKDDSVVLFIPAKEGETEGRVYSRRPRSMAREMSNAWRGIRDAVRHPVCYCLSCTCSWDPAHRPENLWHPPSKKS